MERRRRHFTFPLLRWSLPALVLMFGLALLQDRVCVAILSFAPKAQCHGIPAAAFLVLAGIAAVGTLASLWRFYRDHVRGEADLDSP